MTGFDYYKFKNAIKAAQLQKYEELKIDIAKTKAFVEKMLTLSLDCTANTAKTSYPGIDF